MHAALIRLTIDPAQAPAAAAAFTQTILPRVTAAEGFVAGYWVDPVDGEGFGFVLFETADQARQATPPATAGVRRESRFAGWRCGGWQSPFPDDTIPASVASSGGPMIYAKSFLFGIGGAIVAALFWIAVSFVLPIFMPMLVARMLNRGGASGASITSDSILLAALVGFVAAAWWGSFVDSAWRLTSLGCSSDYRECCPLRTTIPAKLFLDDEPADCETAGRSILWRERDPPDVADIDWTAEFRIGRLEVRIRLHVVEGDPDRLPHAFLQIGPARVDDAVAIEERDREPQRVRRLDLKRNRAPAAPVPVLGVASHVASSRVARRHRVVDEQDRLVRDGRVTSDGEMHVRIGGVHGADAISKRLNHGD